MNFLLDTNVLSEARRPKGAARVKQWLASVETRDPFVSVISIGEIAHGARRLDDDARRAGLLTWLAHVRRVYAGRIIDIDPDIAELWGELSAAARKRGRKVDAPDGLIAATARAHGLHVATRNVRHMLDAGVAVYDPWTGESHEPTP